MHMWLEAAAQFSRMERTPSGPATTISPGSSSRSNLAPTAVRAQVSEAKITAPPRRPMHRGRKPQGSLAAMSFWGDMTMREKAPRRPFRAWHTASSAEGQRSRSWAMA